MCFLFSCLFAFLFNLVFPLRTDIHQPISFIWVITFFSAVLQLFGTLVHLTQVKNTNILLVLLFNLRNYYLGLVNKTQMRYIVVHSHNSVINQVSKLTFQASEPLLWHHKECYSLLLNVSPLLYALMKGYCSKVSLQTLFTVAN